MSAIKREIHLTNELNQLLRLNDFITRTAADFGLDDRMCMRLKLALEEAVTNVILYAYPGENNKTISLFMQKEGSRLTLQLTDAGIPFDPTCKVKPDITLSADERPIGGLGIFLIREIMTEVSYRREGDMNILTMIKELS